jgi:hypothetical protein
VVNGEARQRDELLAALKDIADPIVRLRADADAQGARLNGYAVVLANDANWLRDKARVAIAKAEGKCEV